MKATPPVLQAVAGVRRQQRCEVFYRRRVRALPHPAMRARAALAAAEHQAVVNRIAFFLIHDATVAAPAAMNNVHKSQDRT